VSAGLDGRAGPEAGTADDAWSSLLAGQVEPHPSCGWGQCGSAAIGALAVVVFRQVQLRIEVCQLHFQLASRWTEERDRYGRPVLRSGEEDAAG
jgi:hypothetical protein